MNNYVFAIEGNVGSGKSTLIKYLEKIKINMQGYKIIFLPEPVEEWKKIKNKNGSNIIEGYYKNENKYGFSFQINALISRISQIRKALLSSTNTIFIIERSVHTDKHVFCKMLYDNGVIDKINYEVYLRWYDEFQKDMMISGIIYVNTDIENSHKRIKIRNRKGEENISKEYLTKLDTYHKNWLLDGSLEYPLLNIDGNKHYQDKLPDDWKQKINMSIQNNITNLYMDFDYNVSAWFDENYILF